MKESPGRSAAARHLRPAAAGATVTAIVVLLYFVEPAESAWLPKCPLHWLTGWHCPGCGSTRAAHALLHGNVLRALAYNPLFVGGMPILLAFCVWSRGRFGPGWTTAISVRWIVLLVAVMLVFAVLRNVPAWPFDLLAPH
jgi:Protein of unknown function (DUF2752)